MKNNNPGKKGNVRDDAERRLPVSRWSTRSSCIIIKILFYQMLILLIIRISIINKEKQI